MRRVQLEPPDLMRLAGPLELVVLAAVKEVVLRRAFFDRGLDRETHRDEADAVPGVLFVEAGLVEQHGVAVAEAIPHGRRTYAAAEREKAEPAPRERDAAEVLVKRNQFRLVERFRAAAAGPSAQMKIHEPPEALAAVPVGHRGLERHRAELLQGAQTPPEVVAKRRAPLSEVLRPFHGLEIDVRTDVGRRVRRAPPEAGEHAA